MLIAHVEQEGVWLVEGGMRAVAAALRDVAVGLGVEFRFDCGVRRICVDGQRLRGCGHGRRRSACRRAGLSTTATSAPWVRACSAMRPAGP
jgi:1-hydroxycarotenoid 3,4-desaturase